MDHALTFLVAIVLLTLSPGVDTLLVLRNSARGGWQDGMLTTLGISSGLFVHATVSALGISVILLQSAWAFTAIKLAGAIYLIWLGMVSLRSALRGFPSMATEGVPTRRLKPLRSLSEGILSNVLNPKPVIFYMAFLPQFIDPAGSALAQSLIMALIHFLISAVWLGSLALIAERARRLKMPRLGRVVNGLNGAALVAIGASLVRT
ncbi:MAG: LysE family translocator [Oceanospirillaceae bacterium]|jgi:threonine/homoserine/homoserine lactone efflux protein|uniref:LysE family translocator n=1 Tax=Marinobacterium litorale TaxID=404770 RepID=UPI00055B453F|nr:LysE family translocator [Marinobacterium litorale]MBT00114.1 LysE family translocator [Oceanospirillaceae bacterium]